MTYLWACVSAHLSTVRLETPDGATVQLLTILPRCVAVVFLLRVCGATAVLVEE